MPAAYLTQYQVLAQPPAQSAQPGQSNAAPWLYAWSEPVRKRVIAVALIASGLIAPPAVIPEQQDNWFQQLSTPVRLKPGLAARFQQFTSLPSPPQPLVNSLIQWFAGFPTPVRKLPAVLTGDQAFFFFEPEPPEARETHWYFWWPEPVRLKPGLRYYLQQILAQPPRILPNPNVTMRMAATEINLDVAEFAIVIYNATSSMRVSIREIPVPLGDPYSIQEI